MQLSVCAVVFIFLVFCIVYKLNRLPADGNLMPTLSNGHIGFTTFGDTVHMNGLYNGQYGLSHRARIPNWSNIQIQIDSTDEQIKTVYRLNAKNGILTVTMDTNNLDYRIVHRVYAHRYYVRAIINEIQIERLTYKGNSYYFSRSNLE